MLPRANRLRRRADFGEVVRSGRRLGRRDVVVHLLFVGEQFATTSAPRAGLVVGKQVGGAVVRKQVSRRLRAALAELLPTLPESSRLVVRALPSAADAQVVDFVRQLRSALGKLGLSHRREP